MLQQTRVETAIPYFYRWMKKFPNLKVLAQSTEKEVLVAWEGLGYYRRAHNLLKSARIIQREHGGRFPRNIKSLRSLPGLGPYSSAAIASIAFNQDQPVIDGNIRRVYSRLFDISAPINSTLFERRIRDLAEQNLPLGRAGDFNQALMDFGATICVSRLPKCVLCPVTDHCLAFRRGVQTLRPRIVQAKSIPHEQQAAAVVVNHQGTIRRVLLKKRSSSGMLAGLWEFPNFRIDKYPGQQLTRKVFFNLKVKLSQERLLTTVEHTYAHFKVTVSAYSCRYIKGKITKDFKWVGIDDLSKYPMGKVHRMIANKLLSSEHVS